MSGTSLSALRTDLISADDSSKVNSSEYGLGGAEVSLPLLFWVMDGTMMATSIMQPVRTHAPILRRLLSAQYHNGIGCAKLVSPYLRKIPSRPIKFFFVACASDLPMSRLSNEQVWRARPIFPLGSMRRHVTYYGTDAIDIARPSRPNGQCSLENWRKKVEK